jgi:predicted TIM-barrel fold metal-dependent hydrolase
MIIDLFAHLGPYPHRPVGLEAPALAALLAPYGITRVFAGRLEPLWLEDPHDANRIDERRVLDTNPPITALPVLDPTVATVADELDRLMRARPLPMVRLLPGYGGYTLAEADSLLHALARRRVIAQVVVQVEDPRRQHKRAQIPNVAAAHVLEAAARHPALQVLLCGAGTTDLTALASRLPKAHNLWADTSNADGLGAVPRLLQSAWGDRLVFGTHAPLFIPYSGVSRVLVDLDDREAERVFATNALELLEGARRAKE